MPRAQFIPLVRALLPEMILRISDYKALTFDCYGTLIDWESGILHNLAELSAKADRSLTDDEILEAHALYESWQQRDTPSMAYPRLLATVYRRLAEEWGVAVNWDDCLAYGGSVGNWPAFEDSKAALQELGQRFKLVILSNVDNQSFARSNAKLGVQFDAVYCAEDIGSYKPDRRNFHHMIERLSRQGISAGEILHVAESLFHDHVPAKEMGLNNCWIHRRRGKPGFGATREPAIRPDTDFVFTSMREFAAAAGSE